MFLSARSIFRSRKQVNHLKPKTKVQRPFYSKDIRKAAAVAHGAKTNDNIRNAPNK